MRLSSLCGLHGDDTEQELIFTSAILFKLGVTLLVFSSFIDAILAIGILGREIIEYFL
jgi:hypothetical protein